MTIPEAIQIVFDRSGLTLREFAKRIGISHVHMCNIKSGHSGYSIELLAKIKKEFGYDPYLLAAVANKEVESLDYEALL